MDNGEIRLNKFIADQGVCSRREADALIEAGEVLVNGIPAEKGQKVMPGQDRVNVKGRMVRMRDVKKVTLVVNKPRGYVCTNRDAHAEKTVFDLVPPPWNRERLFCAGRLDKESDGMVILTTDGDLAQRLTHPSQEVTKRYKVRLAETLKQEDIPKLLRGIVWEGERLQVEKVIPDTKAGEEGGQRVEVHLHHGKKQEIRRLFYALGYRVRRLSRIQIGKMTLRGVASGRVRPLQSKEIDLLFS